uniref:DUF1328 domain-containing protein n=1 Tax=Ralstonia solanacearum TaxID=305 RepID=A0A809EA28_RALSL
MPRSAPTALGLSGCQFDPLRENGMLKWVPIFNVIAVMAGLPGFTGIDAGAASLAIER